MAIAVTLGDIKLRHLIPSSEIMNSNFKFVCATPTMGTTSSSKTSATTVLKRLFRRIVLKNVNTTVCEPATDVVLNQGMQLQVAGLMSRHSAAWRRYSQRALSNWLQTRDTKRRMSLCHATSIS